jgi:uncharacterized RDD family membrane protein YckC
VKCPHCGLEVLDDAKFCSNCGSSVEQSKKVDDLTFIYCWNCGTALSEDSSFCTKCGTSLTTRLEIADWGTRFVAWLIDIIILGLILGWVTLPGYVLVPQLRWVPFIDLGTKNLIHFLYWMFMEGLYGQSLGKMVMKIKLTKLDGRPIDLPSAAIQSIGKAFLLPIDVIIGLIFYENKKQRLFNYLSETLVVKR